MADQTPPPPGRIMLLIEATELDLDGDTLRAVVIETPTGLKFTVSEKSNGARFIATLIGIANDATVPRATITRDVGWAEVARDFLRDVAKNG